MIGQTSPINHTRDGLAFPQTVTPNTPVTAAPQGIWRPPWQHRWQNIQGHISYYDSIKAANYAADAERRIAKMNAIALALGAGKDIKKKQ